MLFLISFALYDQLEALSEDLQIPLITGKIFDAEIIIGKIANDTTNPVITAYLNGLYDCMEILRLRKQ